MIPERWRLISLPCEQTQMCPLAVPPFVPCWRRRVAKSSTDAAVRSAAHHKVAHARRRDVTLCHVSLAGPYGQDSHRVNDRAAANSKA